MPIESNEQFVEKLTVASGTTERTGTIAELKQQRTIDRSTSPSRRALSDSVAREGAFSMPDKEPGDGDGGDLGKSLGEAGGGEAVIYYKGAKLAAKVLKGIWDVIKDSQAQATTSADTAKILAEQDSNWQNYTGGQEAVTSPENKWELYNFAGVNCFVVRFKVAVQYGVKHPTLPGVWISSIRVVFSQCDANFPWVLQGTAAVDEKSLYNAGSVSELVPQVQLNISLSAQAKFALSWQDLNTSVAYRVNAKTGITAL